MNIFNKWAEREITRRDAKEAELALAKDYFNNCMRKKESIMRFTINGMLKKHDKWVKRLNSKEKTVVFVGEEVLIAKNGEYALVKLETKNAYKREGQRMHHCVASYWNEHKTTEIWSLRLKGEPITTIEARKYIDNGVELYHLRQVQAKSNKTPTKDVKLALIHLLDETGELKYAQAGFFYAVENDFVDIVREWLEVSK